MEIQRCKHCGTQRSGVSEQKMQVANTLVLVHKKSELNKTNKHMGKLYEIMLI
jgi:hypothetical protein